MYLSKLEQLPDEILLEICIYLKPFDIINSFGQLNSRLERTISQYRRDADLHHLTFSQFQRWSNHLLSYTAESIINLVVSNWNSPGQIYYFNQLTRNYNSLHELFPNIKQLRLIDFTNDDIEILSKLDMIEKIFIDADALITLSYSTHILLDKYLFCSFNHFKEIRLWGVENGIRLQHNINIIENFHLERLTISVALLDDLILMFRRSPNLIHFNAEVVQYNTKELRQNATLEMLPKYIKFFHFQTTDQYVLSYEDLDKLVSNMPTIELLSLDLDTNDLNYADGYKWHNLLSSLWNLTHTYFKIRISLTSDMKPIDIDSILESFQPANLPICCYADSKVLHIDTIPYDMTQFKTNMSVTISPNAKLAKTTNIELFQQRPRRVQTLIVDGQHDSTSIDDWLCVISRFSEIEILQVNAVNILEDENNSIENNNKNIRLPHLSYLHYIRSTSCKVHIPFFKFLANNTIVSPQLKALSMMYGDFIYLCKRLSGFSLERINELWLYGGEADGHVTLKDINLLLKTFPCLYHFVFNNQSSRLMNRHIQSITEMILRSSPKLISFRISCNKGSLKLSSLMDNETCNAWIKQICNLNNHEQIHVIINKKMLSVWK
ncbi:unnamed protein product [Rotaria sordida]|uniref:F-box domain-containing protein n=1 Tax=Rotaria sordida TaxID=392033 RepID=A0A814TTE6_9BILA|nr:unnamed protein product [Rotaria sordida]CAF1199939.1 unnamed protein product [Rotaria sordida]CAF3623302.1 unnamed protein product [Rotaria sordida]CAF3925608.1 unnamed protein product [Rotaria sordida]